MANPFSQPNGESGGNAPWVWGWIALVVFPPVLVLMVTAAKSSGLSTTPAWDHAQLARNMALGEGFVTSFLRPLSLVFQADYQAHPDLYNAPLYPFVLSLFFRLFGASEKVMVAVGGGLWLLSIWLTFGIAQRWFGTRIAGWATLLYASNVGALRAIVEGGPSPLMASGFLLALGLAIPTPRKVSFRFQRGDLKHPRSLTNKLRERADPLSQYLYQRLSPEIQEQLQEDLGFLALSKEFQQALMQELNHILQEPDLYESSRFAPFPMGC